MIKFWQATTYRKSSIKLPLSNKPSPSNKPPPPHFSGKKVDKPPLSIKPPLPASEINILH